MVVWRKQYEVMSTPRLLILHSSDEMYGSDRSLLSLAQAAQAAGGAPLVLLPCDVPHPGDLHEALSRRGIAVRHIDMPVLRREYLTVRGLITLAWKWVSVWRDLNRLTRDHRSELLVSNTAATLVGAAVAYRQRLPHVWLVRETLGGSLPERVLATFVDAFGGKVVANSTSTMRAFATSRFTTRSEISYLYPPIESDSESVDRDTARMTLGLPTERVSVAVIGRISRQKGQMFFLQAASLSEARLSRPLPAWLIIGDTRGASKPSTVDLEHESLRLKIRGPVILRPFMIDIRDYLPAIDIVVIASTSPESFGRVMAEAMLAGCLVIGPDAGGPGECIIHDATGLLYAQNSSEELASVLTRAIEDDAIRQRLAIQGQSWAQDRFSPSKYYSELVASRR